MTPDTSENNSGQNSTTSILEKLLMMLGIALVAGLLLYVTWNIMAATGTRPHTTVTHVQDVGQHTIVTVRLQNPQRVGLNTATVEVNCRQPPIQLTFEYIPAEGAQLGKALCPANTTHPETAIVSWKEI